LGNEQSFEYRIQRLLTNHGFLVVNCARSRPFDLVAIKNQIAVPLELKGKNTPYSKEQKLHQRELASKTRTNFLIVRKGKRRRQVEVEEHCVLGNDSLLWQRAKQEIIDVLKLDYYCCNEKGEH
jgi:Holliday junction resolvase